MISVDIPNWKALKLDHLVLDLNGTLAVDGHVIAGILPWIAVLSKDLTIHVVTGNTYGNAADQLARVTQHVVCLPPGRQAESKRSYVLELGADSVVAIGNGRNDALMMEQAALSVGILGTEGLAVDALNAADIVVRHTIDALGLLLHPKRLAATLRS